MTIPRDELAFYQAYVEAERKREEELLSLPPPTAQQIREGVVLKAQAEKFMDSRELREYLVNMGRRFIPAEGGTVSEHSVWRAGWMELLWQIEDIAKWHIPEEGDTNTNDEEQHNG